MYNVPSTIMQKHMIMIIIVVVMAQAFLFSSVSNALISFTHTAHAQKPLHHNNGNCQIQSGALGPTNPAGRDCGSPYNLNPDLGAPPAPSCSSPNSHAYSPNDIARHSGTPLSDICRTTPNSPSPLTH